MHRPSAVLAQLCAVLVLAATVLAAGGPSAAAASAAETADNSLLLLFDASGSMKESAGGGVTKVTAAKRALDDLVTQLPASSQVGLRVYGAAKDTGCDDTTLVHPVAPLDGPGRQRLRTAIRGFQPRGDTPIGASLQAAAKDLAGSPGRKTVVLVSDGEDTCTPPSPCDVARDLRKQGVDLRVESIGFQVDAAARRQLACVAKVTGGSYHDAPDSRALTGQLQALSLRAFRGFVPLGAPVTGTPDAAGAPALAPGAWVDELAPGETRNYRIDVASGAVPVVNAALIAGATQPRLAGPENFVVALSDGQGNECTRGSASQTSQTFTAAATATGPRAVAGSGTPCTEPGARVLSVQRSFSGGQGTNTVEILYSQIGEPSPAAEPAPAVQPGPAGGSAGAATAVRGGTSYDDAPLLGPGVWRDTLRSSETLYYRVPVGWGQQLKAGVQFDLLTAGKGRAGQMQPLVEVHDALRFDPANRVIAQLTSAAPRSVTIDTPPVLAPAAAADPVTPFKIAGTEYVVVNGSDLLGDAGTAAATVRLTVAVEGTQTEGPRLAVAGADATTSPSAGASPSGSPTPGGEGAGTKADPEPASDGGVPVVVWIVAAVVAALLVAGLLLGRRRSAGR